MADKGESTIVRKVKLPEMKCFFGIKKNPLINDSRVKKMMDQMYEFSLVTIDEYKNVEEAGIESTAYVYPFCSDVTKYINLARFVSLLFLIDDHTECKWGDVARSPLKSKTIWGQFEQCLDKITLSLDKNKSFISMAQWKPYIVLWYIALEEISKHYGDDQIGRLLKGLREYAQANIEETEIIENNQQFKSFDELIKVRFGSSATKTAFLMIEYADDLHLTDQEWYDPLVQRFIEYGVILILIDNDIVSFEKEVSDAKFVQEKGKSNIVINTVAGIMSWDNCSVDEAMEKGAQLYQDYQTKLKEIKTQIFEKPNTSEDLKKFVEHGEYVVGANFEVGRLIKRYYNHRN